MMHIKLLIHDIKQFHTNTHTRACTHEHKQTLTHKHARLLGDNAINYKLFSRASDRAPTKFIFTSHTCNKSIDWSKSCVTTVPHADGVPYCDAVRVFIRGDLKTAYTN